MQSPSDGHGTLLSDIKSERLHWLWEKRIPRGKLTTLDGDPGLGKSLLTLDLAALWWPGGWSTTIHPATTEQ